MRCDQRVQPWDICYQLYHTSELQASPCIPAQESAHQVCDTCAGPSCSAFAVCRALRRLITHSHRNEAPKVHLLANSLDSLASIVPSAKGDTFDRAKQISRCMSRLCPKSVQLAGVTGWTPTQKMTLHSALCREKV